MSVLLTLHAGSHAQQVVTQLYQSKHYAIRTTLSREEALVFGRHMDIIFADYTRRFSEFKPTSTDSMPLYLFRKQEEYELFLTRKGFDPRNTGGLFFHGPNIQGVATFIENRSRSEVFSVLQHEGFHQFAFTHIGRNLPTWVNEGLAQYYEDGIIVGDSLRMGMASARRIESVKTALRMNKAIEFDRLLQMSNGQWMQTLIVSNDDAALLYDQSWSIVYFLIRGDNGKYRQAFLNYLMLVAKGADSGIAFRKAFGSDDTEAFRKRWEMFASSIVPDPLPTTIARMEFLALGLRFLHERKEPPPKTLHELKDRLQRIQFRVSRNVHGGKTELSALDESIYTFQRANGTTGHFDLLEPTAAHFPPRLLATGIRPEPTLVWWRDPQDQIAMEITFR